MNASFCATGNHHVCVAVFDEPHGISYRVSSSCASSGSCVVWTLRLVFVYDYYVSDIVFGFGIVPGIRISL